MLVSCRDLLITFDKQVIAGAGYADRLLLWGRRMQAV
jgi:hypothetical protein